MSSSATSPAETAVSSALHVPEADEEDAFLLITRQPSLVSLQSASSVSERPRPSGSALGDDSPRRYWKLERNWPLVGVAILDLVLALVNIIYHHRPPAPPSISIDIIRLRTLAISRPLFLIPLSLHTHWRRGSVWVITASVISLLVVLWEVNEGMQWRRVEGGRKGSRLFTDLLESGGTPVISRRSMMPGWPRVDPNWRWLHRLVKSEMLLGLVLQTFFATLEYLAFFVPLHLSPFAPQGPSIDHAIQSPASFTQHRSYGTNPRPTSRFVPRTRKAQVEDAMRTQRATSVRWDEEEVYASGGESSARRANETGVPQAASVSGGMTAEETNPWVEDAEREGGTTHTLTLDHASDHHSSGPSIGRYSDEGESDNDSDSDDSISSNEIIDLPPPRSASYRGLNPTDSPGRPSGARLDRNESGFSSVGGGQRVRSESSGAVEAIGGLGLDDREAAEQEALLGMSSTPPRDESRLERGLRKRWVRRAKDVFARNRTVSGSGGVDGQYGTFARRA